jgi:hypothetical protein
VSRLGLLVARFASAAWVGAALLFVVTAVREVLHPGFDSATKDELALLRFPAYYACGFTLVTCALLGALAAASGPSGRRPLGIAALVLALVLVLLTGDFLAVYRPMVAMLTPPGQAHAAEFRTYHRLSMWLNVAHVGLCAFAALLLCWPPDRREVAGPSRVE